MEENFEEDNNIQNEENIVNERQEENNNENENRENIENNNEDLNQNQEENNENLNNNNQEENEEQIQENNQEQRNEQIQENGQNQRNDQIQENNQNQGNQQNQGNNNIQQQENVQRPPLQQNNNAHNPQLEEIARKKREENDKTVEIIKSKIKDLREKYSFSIKYYELMINKIIKMLKDLSYEKLSNSISECSNYFSFFKNSSELYSNFAEKIKVSNNSIMSSLNIPKMNDNFLLGVMQKTQNLLFQNLSLISNGLKQNIISRGPLSKLEEKVDKIESIKKANAHKLKEIEELHKKVAKHFHKYDKLFESYLPEPNSNNNANNNVNNNRNRIVQRPALVDTPDFILIINELMERINKFILTINLFVVDTKDSFYKINQLFVEMNNLVRDSVLIYIRESKKVFNIDVAKNFEEIENYYKNLEKSNEDKMFKLTQIFNSQQSQDNIHNLLQQYYVLLWNSGRVKQELINDRNNFAIAKYSNLLLFFEWLISISPQPIGVVANDLIIKEIKLKRDPGVFKSWRNCIMMFTRQHHLLLYDNSTDKLENLVKIFELDKTSYRKKLDNKKPFLFEIIANRKGKIMDFKGTFLFDGLNEQKTNQVHPLILDAY